MKKYDVAICGYGPVGSVCSILLAQYGLKVLVIDKSNGPSPTARAINTDSEQLRTFNFLNIASEIISNSRTVNKVHFTDSEFNPYSTIDIPKEDILGWPPTLLFYQPELESFIRKQVNLQNNITVMESSTLTNFNNNDKGVELYIENSKETINIFSKLLVYH